MRRWVEEATGAVVIPVAAALVAAPALADGPSWAGGGKETGHGHQEAHRHGTFGEHQERRVHDDDSTEIHGGRCPPGLAKKNDGCMPSGQAGKGPISHPCPPDRLRYNRTVHEPNRGAGPAQNAQSEQAAGSAASRASPRWVAFSPERRAAGPLPRAGARLGRRATTLALDLVVLKPLAVFVWWFSQRANRIHFPEREALLRSIQGALAAGRPVVVAANHVSWFDDPVIPMALHRTGQRAGLEILALVALGGIARALPAPLGVCLVLAGALAIAAFGVRKRWWTLGDLVNLSDASVLRGKLELTRKRPPGRLLRALLRAADVVIPWFMRSGTVRTIFVDRRAGEQARRTRARAIDAAVEVAARPEPIWLFFEGGRTKTPGRLAPARRGVGALILGLRDRGLQPLVVVVVHRGMERLIPPGGSRFLSFGHRVEVRWSEFDVERCQAVARRDDQAIAEAVREQALRLNEVASKGDAQRG